MKNDWTQFYTNLFNQEEGVFDSFEELEKLDLGFKKFFPKSSMDLSPDGRFLVFTANHIGKYQVVLMDLETGQKRNIFRYGSKNAVQQTDFNYPQIAWHPRGGEITLCYEHRDVITLRRLDLNSMTWIEQEVPEIFQRIYSIDYLSDDDYLFSASADGFSDLFIYRSQYRQTERITEDYYDDLDASFAMLGQQPGILFSSNRTSSGILPERLDTILPLDNFDVFFLPLESDFALRLTNTPDDNERQPRIAEDRYLTFLDRRNGMRNRWVIDLNSRRRQFINSNYSRNIILHDAVSASGDYVFQVYEDGVYESYRTTPNWNESSSVYYTSSASLKTIREDVPEVEIPEPEPVSEEFLFQSEFPDPAQIEPLETTVKFNRVNESFVPIEYESEEREVIEFINARAVAARRQFKMEEITARVDNEVLFEGLESYAGERQELEAQEPGLLIKGIAKDIFEDFEIELGIRIPLDLRGSEVFAVLDDKRKRIDKRFALYRRQKSEDVILGSEVQRQKKTAFIALHRQSYPFDAYRSVRGTVSLRIDNTFLLTGDPISSAYERQNEQRFIFKGEYVFDNTIDIDLNLRHGTRYKAYVELINRFDLSTEGGFDLDFSRGFTTIVGFDARHYQPVLRNSVLALRAAGATSFGSDKILYYVGGTDGWVIPKFNEDTPVPQNENFSLMTIAPNLRGFNHNVRNGRSFMLASAEMRIPIFKYLSRREMKSKFLRNIQLVGFFDVGSAWHGFLPKSSNNPLNNVIIDDVPGISISLNLKRRSFIYGYGFGGRINLFGYYIRGDYAWGVESGIVNDPILYISLGTDF
jgi:hypothetical protein